MWLGTGTMAWDNRGTHCIPGIKMINMLSKEYEPVNFAYVETHLFPKFLKTSKKSICVTSYFLQGLQ